MLRTALGEYSPATCLICREPGFFLGVCSLLKIGSRNISLGKFHCKIPSGKYSVDRRGVRRTAGAARKKGEMK